jgi:hypothetical protein
MHEPGWRCGQRSCGEGMKQMGRALHDLCQPLTTLQCRLEIAVMTGTGEAHREAVEQGLADCARLTEAVASMREIVRTAIHQAESTEAAA